MRSSLVLLLPLCLAASALAQPATPSAPATPNTPAAPSVAGHDHGAPHQSAPADETAVDYMWRKSDEAFHDGDYERAIALHKGIIAIAPDEVESYGNAAWLLWSLGRGKEAIALIERGLKANPNDWEMWQEAAQHYSLQKLADRERDAYQRAIELAPAGTDTQMMRRALAHAAERSGELALAVATWRQLVKEFPNEAVNRNNLARAEKLLNGQKDKAAPQAALPPSGLAALALVGLSGALLLPASLAARPTV
jgi:tetratricopeptide (TPR) repeat protein